MSLGIFDRLFSLLEGECKRLDVAMAESKSGGGVGGASFQRYTAALKQPTDLKESINWRSRGPFCTHNWPLTFQSHCQSQRRT